LAEHPYTRRQLFEMAACTGCAVCAEVCPAVQCAADGRLSGLHRLDWRRRSLRRESPWLSWIPGLKPPSRQQWQAFADTVYRCTLCGRCQEACPAGIGLKGLWLGLRQEIGDHGLHPAKAEVIRDNLAESHNVFGEDQADRLEWVEDLDEEPEDQYLRQAEVVYFTGCVASFFPLAQQIPAALAEVFEAAGVDFAILGEEEHCCGFPLLGAGMAQEARALIEHNLAAVRAAGAKRVVFACPSCYLMWKEHYPAEFELVHATQFLAELVEAGRVPLKPLDLTVTYHDPCDLGRGSREFEAPRRVIRAIPGVRLVELGQSHEQCQCCGGGGNLEMIDAGLSGEIARRKVEEILATGADAVVTACQQCVRTMATYARRHQLPVQVLDLAQLVKKALAPS
jgi:heterodisulfide reductase subunit D